MKNKKYESIIVQELIDDNLLSSVDHKRLEMVCKNQSITVDQAILKLGLMEESELFKVAAKILNTLYIDDLLSFSFDKKTILQLTEKYCQYHNVMPIYHNAKKEYFILTDKPFNEEHIKEIVFHLGAQVKIAISTRRFIKNNLLTYSEAKTSKKTPISREQHNLDQEAIQLLDKDGPVISFVMDTFSDAVEDQASDIHFETQEYGLRIRVRINGRLQSYTVDHSLNVSEIIARVKILAEMNVSERRLPQDGRASINIDGRKVDLRISSVPTSFGESLVCRILDPKALRLGWNKLGFNNHTIKQIKTIIEKPNGIFLITGPTGSGKTTTLYTALKHLNKDNKKILTIEDPIEYNLEGIEQVQVKENIGMTFSTALRAFLRQDPDTIMIGEIRDTETAEIACRSALIGRMVLSTLHTNSPEGAVDRLVNLGVEKYLIQDVLRGVLGQTLQPSSAGIRKLQAKLITY